MGRFQVKKDYGEVDTKVSITHESIVSSELVIQVEDQTGEILTEFKRNSLVPSIILVMMLVNGLMLVFYFLRQPILKWLKIN